MEFKTQTQKVCYEKIAPMMKEIFGEFVHARDDAPVFISVLGSAFAATAVYPWGDDDAVINTRSWVVTGAEATPELLRFLLEANFDMRFGAFGMDKDGDIFFEHAIVGSSADKEEVKASVIAVVKTADDYDDKIVGRWGGQRAADRTK